MHSSTPSGTTKRGRPSVPRITLFRRDHQLHYARLMRRSPTRSEQLLWKALRSRDALGFRARRQVVIGAYVVDILIPAAALVVEVDGSAHYGQEWNDALRQRELEFLGYSVFRVTAPEVERDVAAVVARIRAEIVRVIG